MCRIVLSAVQDFYSSYQRECCNVMLFISCLRGHKRVYMLLVYCTLETNMTAPWTTHMQTKLGHNVPILINRQRQIIMYSCALLTCLWWSWATHELHRTCGEHVAKWIGHWIQKVWGSILTTGDMQNCEANFSFHAASVHPAVMGTCWNEKMLHCTDRLQLQKYRILQGIKLSNIHSCI